MPAVVASRNIFSRALVLLSVSIFIILGTILQIEKEKYFKREFQKLEPVCCKKRQKIVPDQLLVCGVGDL